VGLWLDRLGWGRIGGTVTPPGLMGSDWSSLPDASPPCRAPTPMRCPPGGGDRGDPWRRGRSLWRPATVRRRAPLPSPAQASARPPENRRRAAPAN